MFTGCNCKVPLPSLWLEGHTVLSQVYHVSFPCTMGVNSCMSVCERKQGRQNHFSIARCSWAFLLHSQSFLHCYYLQMCWKYSLVYLPWLFFLGRKIDTHKSFNTHLPSGCELLITDYFSSEMHLSELFWINMDFFVSFFFLIFIFISKFVYNNVHADNF